MDTTRKLLKKESEKWPKRLIEIPKAQWPGWQSPDGVPPSRVLRSKEFLVQEYPALPPVIARLSICRTSLTRSGAWSDRVTWDELQRLKGEAGYGRWDAVEVYPADQDIVNVANMRHLWVLGDEISFAWRVGR